MARYAALALWAGLLIAGTGRLALAQESCPVPPVEAWSQVEQSVWQQLCAGEWANLNADAAEPLDPAQDEGWDERTVSASFLEAVIEEPYAAAIDRHGIRLEGAWIPATLRLDDAVVPFPVRCVRCRIAGVNAGNATVRGELRFDGSRIEGDLVLRSTDIEGSLSLAAGASVEETLDARDVAVRGTLFLDRESTFADVRLVNAAIDVNLDANEGSTITGALSADRLSVGGTVFLDGSTLADTRLIGASITGNLQANNECTFTGTLTADRLSVGGDVLLDDESTFADVRLAGATIGGNLDANNGSSFSGMLDGGGLEVGGTLLLGGGSTFTDVRLVGATIGGNLEIRKGSTVSGTLSGDLLSIGGAALLGDGSSYAGLDLTVSQMEVLDLQGAAWLDGSFLDLQFASVGTLLTGSEEALPSVLRLNGLTLGGWPAPDPRGVGAEWYVDHWLGPDALPETYEQLAAVLDRAGHKTLANDIRYELRQAERKDIDWYQPERLARDAYWAVLGYGIRPWAAIGWAALIWAVGVLVLLGRDQAAGWAALLGAVGLWVVVGPWNALGPAAVCWVLAAAILVVQHRRVPAGRRRPPSPKPEPMYLGVFRAGGTTRPWQPAQAALQSLARLLPTARLVHFENPPPLTPRQHAWLNVQHVLGLLLGLFVLGWLAGLLG